MENPQLTPGTGAASPSKYDCIVVDPPWENASARRKGAYQALPSRYMLGIPVPSLLAEVSLMSVFERECECEVCYGLHANK